MICKVISARDLNKYSSIICLRETLKNTQARYILGYIRLFLRETSIRTQVGSTMICKDSEDTTGRTQGFRTKSPG